MEIQEDLYAILNVSDSAPSEEIKKQYRKLSLKYHPDRNPGGSDTFKKISSAYEILGDERKRKEYDIMRKLGIPGTPGMAGMPGMPGMPGMGSFSGMGGVEILDPNDILNMLFAGGGMFPGPLGGNTNPGVHIFHNGMSGGQHMKKPSPIIKTVEISLEQAFTGCTVSVEIERWIEELNKRKQENERLYITIPKGIDDDEIIIVENKGNHSASGYQGDVKLFIKVRNETNFDRDGLDLIYYKNISFRESLCGFSFDLPYMDGKIFKINNSSGTVITHNFKKVIKDMGMRRDGEKGNLIITFSVEYPEKLSPDQVDKLKEIL